MRFIIWNKRTGEVRPKPEEGTLGSNLAWAECHRANQNEDIVLRREPSDPFDQIWFVYPEFLRNSLTGRILEEVPDPNPLNEGVRGYRLHDTSAGAFDSEEAIQEIIHIAKALDLMGPNISISPAVGMTNGFTARLEYGDWTKRLCKLSSWGLDLDEAIGHLLKQARSALTNACHEAGNKLKALEDLKTWSDEGIPTK